MVVQKSRGNHDRSSEKHLSPNGVKPFWYAILTGKHENTKNMSSSLSSGTVSSLNMEVILEHLELIKESLQNACIKEVTARNATILFNEASGTRFAASIDSGVLSNAAGQIIKSYSSRKSGTLVYIINHLHKDRSGN